MENTPFKLLIKKNNYLIYSSEDLLNN